MTANVPAPRPGAGASTGGAGSTGSTRSTRQRIVDAAFELFDQRGFEATTVEQIAEQAGVSRSTFFRAFASKEDVIFPDHAVIQARIVARLAAAGDGAETTAVVEAARVVLEHFIGEGDVARSRYALTRTVPALRDREIAGMLGYQRIFRDFVRSHGPRPPGTGLRSELHAELMANAVVAAHNVVLRRWLRGLTSEPHEEFDDAMREVVARFEHDDVDGRGEAAYVVVIPAGLSPAAAAAQVAASLRDETTGTGT